MIDDHEEARREAWREFWESDEVQEYVNSTDFIRDALDMHEARLAKENDDDYVLNEEQWGHYIKLATFLGYYAVKYGGKIETQPIQPKRQSGGITAYFDTLDLMYDQVSLFCEVISHCCAFGIDAMTDGRVSIDCTVPRVFEKRPGI